MKYSKKSKAILKTVHEDLQLIFNEYIKQATVDISIMEGIRTAERQNHLYLQKLSKLDGYNKISKHQLGRAIDIAIYGTNNIYDENHLCFVAGNLIGIAKKLYEEDKIDYILRWGGNWDNDGIIIKDQNFKDLVHFELMEVER